MCGLPPGHPGSHPCLQRKLAYNMIKQAVFPDLNENFVEVVLDPQKVALPNPLHILIAERQLVANQLLVAELIKSFNRGRKLPPIEVFQDGDDYWLAGKWEVFLASQYLQINPIQGRVRPGNVKEAALYFINQQAAPRSARQRRQQEFAQNLRDL